MVKSRKKTFFDVLNRDIEAGKILNWKQFKRLKSYKAAKSKFDSYDMKIFEDFFKKLYSNDHATISSSKKEELLKEANKTNESYCKNIPQMLNIPFTIEEISKTISTLKNGKSSADDLISNEILNFLSEKGRSLLLKLFNFCLDTGTYPWNNSIISPLHKKGCKSDPDNYRAIAVSSTLGKLFSTVILNRIIAFRKNNFPDPLNQLGFTKGAQTYDHILTLNTITSKYKKLRKPIYAVFVDFRKAFDSVCREALFFKLSNLGITGKVYNVLQHMYTNSTGQIKLSGHVSNKIPIKKGTEQGHPLSPDLFKLYIKDLSPNLDFKNCPQLLDQIVSHLLWADDRILLALDPITLQKQLDILNKFCISWGVDINIAKTKLMTFNDKYIST